MDRAGTMQRVCHATLAKTEILTERFELMGTELLFKCLSKGGVPAHGGTGTWHLPNGRPGKWMPVIEDIEECVRGYHGCRRSDVVHWLGEEIYTLEVRGGRIDGDTKIVVAQARLLRKIKAWNARTQQLFACDCAEHVLHLFEDQYPTDKRPRNAIDVARRFAAGEATKQELASAARAASAAWAARYARAAGATSAAWAAWAASAAWAAWDAGAAAGDAERKWQTDTLMEYLEIGE